MGRNHLCREPGGYILQIVVVGKIKLVHIYISSFRYIHKVYTHIYDSKESILSSQSSEAINRYTIRIFQASYIRLIYISSFRYIHKVCLYVLSTM